jgi:hypothetical protein
LIAEPFRLAILNPGGRDPEQDFSGESSPNENSHAPVNFHAYAACTGGSFHRETSRALATERPVLLLLRGDFKESQRALVALTKAGRKVVVSLKETGLHQIAKQLTDARRAARFAEITAAADGCLAATPEAVHFYPTARFIPTPYPMADESWNFATSITERAGIFVGTREWEVPTRNHHAALILARELSAETDEPVTVFNYEGGKGARQIAVVNFPPEKLRVFDHRIAYRDYLRLVARHKIVLQLDKSAVPGQVAGDALLCRMPCVGGDGAIDRIGFADSCGYGRSMTELRGIAARLLREPAFYEQAVIESQRRATEQLSFAAIAVQLEEFFGDLL